MRGGGQTFGDLPVGSIGRTRNGIFVIAREAKQSTPSFTPSLASLSTSSVIDFHPQSATVNFIAAKTRIAVTSGNGTSTGIDQIVASNPSAVALRQPFRYFAKPQSARILMRCLRPAPEFLRSKRR